MLFELVATDNLVSYNITLAKLLGLEAAIHVSELINIYQKAFRKAKLKEDNMMKLDRDYIESRTTLDVKKQLNIEEKLAKLSIVIKHESDPNLIGIDIGIIEAMMKSEDEDIVKSIKKLARVRGASMALKRDAMVSQLKLLITTDNVELKDAYFAWIDSAISKVGWLSKKSIINAQEIIDKFSNHNLDVALGVIEIAEINGYKDMQWAINAYNKNYRPSYNLAPVQINQGPIELGEDVF